MTTKQGLTISLKSARIMALIFFSFGTFLFLINVFTEGHPPIVTFGFLFVVFAVIFNSIVLFILLVDLIRKDRLESFFAICIILSNIPIAAGYLYIIMEYGPIL